MCRWPHIQGTLKNQSRANLTEVTARSPGLRLRSRSPRSGQGRSAVGSCARWVPLPSGPSTHGGPAGVDPYQDVGGPTPKHSSSEPYECRTLPHVYWRDSSRHSIVIARRTTSLPRVPLISIVDDDQSVREATRSLVRSLGFAATTYPSAEEFLASDRVHETSCLITDVQMPGLSGVALQSRLIAHGRRMPVIFITASPDERVRAQAAEAGAVGYLGKPFDEDCLLACLDAALSHR